MTSLWTRGDPAAGSGLHLGDGLFETVLVFRGAHVRLAEHVARMRRSGAELGIRVPDDLERIVDAELARLVAAERGPERAALRIVVERGTWRGLSGAGSGSGGALVLAVRALPDAPLPPARALVLDQPRIDPAHPLAGKKTLSWMTFVEARRRAESAGADVAILRTSAGDLAEADSANLFLEIEGGVVTPPLDRGVLPGITRAHVIRRLRDAGHDVTERRISDDDLRAASSGFLSSSLDGLRALRSVDGRNLACPGRVQEWLGDCSGSRT
ncbi:MAG: Aminodeoxychorismate lyase [Planctomycetes bacterium]|nr:Aminodeoxychorismate lyase [Planctomycetota bacterium]